MCELFACPLEIQPRRILAALKEELRRRGVANPHVRRDLRPEDVRSWRQIPSNRLARRLGLAEYDVPPVAAGVRVAVSRVMLRLDQHAGAPAVAVVKEGDRLLSGDVVGEKGRRDPSARVHASIDGVVASVSEREVMIAADEGGSPRRR
jgi:Na+-translocating ferredoxin:NAD+ oxidoreductase RnfC subunit